MSSFFFFYQQRGGEDAWQLENAARRSALIDSRSPAFCTVLDLSGVPLDGDWAPTRYKGPLYFDFDAEDDLPLACEQFKAFLKHLRDTLNFDIGQARLYASGGKGFHVEIPPECFMGARDLAQGVRWLPYVYQIMAQSLAVPTMDMNVYSGKRGRMWRTPGVPRNAGRYEGRYKVPLTVQQALGIDAALYESLTLAPAPEIVRTAPTLCALLEMRYANVRLQVSRRVGGQAKRLKSAHEALAPWQRTGRSPPVIAGLMDGTLVRPGVGFQKVAMQLAIYAVSMGLSERELVQACAGLCERHESDSQRYRSVGARQQELARLHTYMQGNAMYGFEVAPLKTLVKPGVKLLGLEVLDAGPQESASGDLAPSLGSTSGSVHDSVHDVVHEVTHDGAQSQGRRQAPSGQARAGAQVMEVNSGAEPAARDPLSQVRRGFLMTDQGMFKQQGDQLKVISRASFQNVQGTLDLLTHRFMGYTFDLRVQGRAARRASLPVEAFKTASSLQDFFGPHELVFQGVDADALSLLDVLSHMPMNPARTSYVYPREGFFVIDHPFDNQAPPVKIYLTQSQFQSSVSPASPGAFDLRYRAVQAASSYQIDLHLAPPLESVMAAALSDLFEFSKPEVVADMVGWFVACHYRSLYLYLFRQFPLLHVHGEAGAGKSQTIHLLAHLHWFQTPIRLNAASAFTPYALDCEASSSTSAPLIVDEYKPRELKALKGGKHEKLKDVFKASYIGGEIAARGTVNKGAESSLGVVRCQASAPIVYLSESPEMESALQERSVGVGLSKNHFSASRTSAFRRLSRNPRVLSSLGRALVEAGFAIDLEVMREQVEAIQLSLEQQLARAPHQGRLAPRMLFNRAIIIHALHTLARVLTPLFGAQFDPAIGRLLKVRGGAMDLDTLGLNAFHARSEMSKVINRLALLSRERDQPYELRLGLDYRVLDGAVEIKAERGYDCYRRYCAALHDQPLFDTLEAFLVGLSAYSACQDLLCAASSLRQDGDTAQIVRLDTTLLAQERLNTFRV